MTHSMQIEAAQCALSVIETQNPTQHPETKRTMEKTRSVPRVINPLTAIRRKCLDCCNNQWKEVELCTVPHCEIFPYRLGKKPGFAEYLGRNGEPLTVIPSTIKAIRAKCLECAGSTAVVKDCPIPDCPLYVFRMGTNPNITPETRAKRREANQRLTAEGKNAILARPLAAPLASKSFESENPTQDKGAAFSNAQNACFAEVNPCA